MDNKEIREQAIRDTRTNFILDAALKVFAEKGFHESRLEDIAAAAGFSKAALYNYYEDKESIFLSLAVRDFDEMILALKKEIREDARIDQNLESGLKTVFSFFGAHFGFFLDATNFRTMTHENLQRFSNHHKELGQQFKTKFSQLNEIFSSAVSQARKNGEIACPFDDRIIGSYISSLVHGVVFEWKINGKMGDINTEVKRIVQFACHGLCIKDDN